jgi:hypothetical protein
MYVNSFERLAETIISANLPHPPWETQKYFSVLCDVPMWIKLSLVGFFPKMAEVFCVFSVVKLLTSYVYNHTSFRAV